MKLLVTGASGVLGSELLRQAREFDFITQITCVSRKARASEGRAHWIEADLADRGATSNPEFCMVARQADVVIHAAADVAWKRPLEQSVSANVHATQNLLDSVKSCGKSDVRFVHVSTAYAEPPERTYVGKRPDHLLGTHLANNYEYTKLLSERCVEDSGLEYNIERCSLIIGSSADGSISSFNGIYFLFRFFASGMMPVIPGDETHKVDCVPVNFVASEVLKAAFGKKPARSTSQIVSGKNSLTVGETARQIVDQLNVYRQAHGRELLSYPAFIDTERYDRFHKSFVMNHCTKRPKAAIRVLEAFMPYLSASGELQPINAPAGPDPRSFFWKVVDNWCVHNHRLATSELYDWRQGFESA